MLPLLDSRYKFTSETTKNDRDECDDMQEAIKLLYEFKAKLDKLHPNCLIIIDHMLQKQRY